MSQSNFDVRRILVVDDIAVNRIVTKALLSSVDYEVDCAEDGRSALDAIGMSDYDLVLMDLDMPVLDGHSAAAALRDREIASGGTWKRPTIVALTAHDSKETRERSRSVGIKTHIALPISPKELIKKVNSLVAALPFEHERQLWCFETYSRLSLRLGHARMANFLRSMSRAVASLQEAIASEETGLAEIRRMAHDMVAVGGVLGFEDLAFACAKVQVLECTVAGRGELRAAERALEAALQAVADYDDSNGAPSHLNGAPCRNSMAKTENSSSA